MNTENAMAEQVRQYNENLALEKQQMQSQISNKAKNSFEEERQRKRQHREESIHCKDADISPTEVFQSSVEDQTNANS